MSALKNRVAGIAAPVIAEALALLPRHLDTGLARVVLAAFALQESELLHRRQLGNGPARGLWQFELGAKNVAAGVWGVYKHQASASMLVDLCAKRGVEANPRAIWSALETDDVLAAGVARLLMWTDAPPLPRSKAGVWAMYAKRTWRPGRPKPDVWPANWMAAVEYGLEVGWIKGYDPIKGVLS